MTRRSGSADLPLHHGRVPAWLGERMARLGAVIAEAIVHRVRTRRVPAPAGPPLLVPVLRRGDGDGLAFVRDHHERPRRPPARPRAAARPSSAFSVCGGRGRQSRRTPDELLAVGERTGLDGAALGRASRLVAKVDSAAVQDGFELYLHGFIVADDGKWVVVQQGMNGDTRYARRYHWLSEGLTSFVEAPHAAIDGASQGEIVNLTDRRAAASRAGADRAAARSRPRPDRRPRWRGLEGRTPPPPEAPLLPHLVMPAHHDVRPKDVMIRRLHGALAAAADRGPSDFAELLLVPGVGAPHRAGARDGGRGRPRRALPLRRPGALLARPRRQGPRTLRGADRGLRPHHRRPEVGDRSRPARRRRAPRRDPPPRRRRRGGSNAPPPARRCRSSSRPSAGARTTTAASACSARSRAPAPSRLRESGR